jgi:hypothetical protein
MAITSQREQELAGGGHGGVGVRCAYPNLRVVATNPRTANYLNSERAMGLQMTFKPA